MASHRAVLWTLGAALALAGASEAAADAIDPEPVFCPPWTRAYSDHGGTGCAPEPPDDCPDGYVPMVVNDVAYCEPPPATACPTGSVPSSVGPDQPTCDLLRPCERDDECGAGSSCRPTGLCIDPSALPDRDPRFAIFRVFGECETDADCDSGRACSTVPRCDPDVDRVDPQGRTLPAIVRSCAFSPLACYGGCATGLVLAGALGVVVMRRRRAQRTHR